MTKLRLVCASAVLAATASGTALADVTANVGLSSDYIWRGIYRAEASASGGIDYNGDSGFYMGLFGANVKDGMEYDIYAGYEGGGENFQWYAGVTGYYFTDEFSDSYEEVNLGFSYGFLNFNYALGDFNGPVFDAFGNQVNLRPDGNTQEQTYEYLNWTFTPEVGPYYAISKWDFHNITGVGLGGSGGYYYEVGKAFEVADDLEFAVAAYYSTDTQPGSATPSPIILSPRQTANFDVSQSADFALSLSITKFLSLGD